LAAPRGGYGPPVLSGSVTAYHPGTDLVKERSYWMVRPHRDGGYEWQTGIGSLSDIYQDVGRTDNIFEAVWQARQSAQRIAEEVLPPTPPIGPTIPDPGPPVS
jgi:hypothetical protein